MRKAKKAKPEKAMGNDASKTPLPLDEGVVLDVSMTVELFRLWSVAALKSYLHARKNPPKALLMNSQQGRRASLHL